MFSEIEGYDWAEVFGDTNSSNGSYSYGPSNHDPWRFVNIDSTMSVSEKPISREDVSKILWIQEGEPDEKNWRVLAELKDGRYIFADGWCDYTGWGCQDGVQRFVSDSLETLLQWAITPDERKEIGL